VEPDTRIWERIKGKMPKVRSDQEAEHPEPVAAAADDQSMPTLVPAESPAPGLETPAGPAPEPLPDAPLPDALAVPGPKLEPGPAAVSDSASAAIAAPVAIPAALAEAREESAMLCRRLRRWRALAVLMIFLLAAMAALLALWRLMPDSVPTALRPLELIRRMGIEVPPSPSLPPARRTAPRDSQFQE
jgi:hypothetical protein